MMTMAEATAEGPWSSGNLASRTMLEFGEAAKSKI